MAPHCLEIPPVVGEYLNPRARLPYGLTPEDITAAMVDVYETLHGINTILFERSERRLEDTLLGNSVSGVVSELLVKAIADKSPALSRNERVGGHPDLLPVGCYESVEVLHGEHGIELKASIQKGGWQGHNPEHGWVVVFRYVVDAETTPVGNREPTRFVQVDC